MCYEVTQFSLMPDVVPHKVFKIKRNINRNYHVSGFSRPFLGVTLNNDADSIVDARWKLIPSWIKSEADANKYANTLNARDNSIFELASFKNLIEKNRGLLYVDGFWEPHASDGKKNDESHFVYQPDKSLFTLGIVYNLWQNEEGELYPTFSIITTTPNEKMSEIHNVGLRMPLIIPEADRDAWLFAQGKDEIKSMFKPFEGEIASHRTLRTSTLKGQMDDNIKILEAI